MTLSLAIAGATGRIGSLAVAACSEAPDLSCSAALVSEEHAQLGQDAGEVLGLGPLGVPLEVRPSAPFDVLIDFSLPAALEGWLELCARSAKPLVLGATGHGPAQLQVLEALAQRVAVLRAPNLALGPSVMLELAREAARRLGPGFGVRIEELHHAHKRDAPSGTARMLGEALREQAGAEVPITSRREGDVTGEHRITFHSEGESLTLVHEAHSPLLFAQGALRAARWIVGQPPGLYGMHDLVAGLGQA